MASITTSGSPLACAFIKGAALPQTQRVQTFGITGVDGVGVHLLGLFGENSSWSVIQYGSISGLNTWFNTLVSLQGTIQTVLNDEAQSYPNQLIEKVSQPTKRTAIDLKGSVETWTVQVVTRTV